jgi:phosphohistidine phosphatase
MTTLVLVRHAKSEWGDGSSPVPDAERPLNDRGMRDAPVMARRLADADVRPEIILSSPAIRARTTAEAFSAEFDVAVNLDPRLYGASAETILTVLAKPRARSVVVVAHDPGMSVLAAQLSDYGIDHMPTCAVAVFEWDETEWDAALTRPPASWSFDAPKQAPPA